MALPLECQRCRALCGGVRGQASVVSVERHGPGLARFIMEKLKLNQDRDGTLKGQDEAGSVAGPGLTLLFPDGKVKS